MSQLQLGHNAYIGVGQEVTWGTWVDPTEFMRIISHSLKNITPKVTRPSLGNPVGIGVTPGTKSIGGDVAMEFLYEGCESMLAFCLGVPEVTAAAPVYTWSFKPRTALWANRGMSLSCNYDDVANDYTGIKISSVTLSMAKDQNLQLTASMGGRAWVAQPDPWEPTFPTDRPIMESELVFAIDTAPVTNIQSFSITMSNALSFDRASLGSGYILEPQRNDLIAITGNFTCDMLDNSYQVKQNTGDDLNLDFTFTSPLLIGGGATPYSMHIDLPKVYFIGDTPPVSGPGVVQQTVNFQAVYDDTGGVLTAMEITLVNGKSAGVGDGV